MKINIILPSYRQYENVDIQRKPTVCFDIIKELNSKNIITFTPAGQDDDIFTLKFAMELNALILSNDKFDDEKFRNNDELFKYYSKKYFFSPLFVL